MAGRTPRVAGDGLTIRELLNRFLTAKQHLVDTREITQRHWDDLHGTCERIKEQFGLTRLVVDLASDDFEAFRGTLAKTRGPSALSNEIQRTRAVFKFAFDNGLIDRPVRYGSSFKKPSKKIMRQTRQARGLQMFEAAEIRKMLDKAGPHCAELQRASREVTWRTRAKPPASPFRFSCPAMRHDHIRLTAAWR